MARMDGASADPTGGWWYFRGRTLVFFVVVFFCCWTSCIPRHWPQRFRCAVRPRHYQMRASSRGHSRACPWQLASRRRPPGRGSLASSSLLLARQWRRRTRWSGLSTARTCSHQPSSPSPWNTIMVRLPRLPDGKGHRSPADAGKLTVHQASYSSNDQAPGGWRFGSSQPRKKRGDRREKRAARALGTPPFDQQPSPRNCTDVTAPALPPSFPPPARSATIRSS